jgi:nucleoside-diphosphate-sugar epimerase
MSSAEPDTTAIRDVTGWQPTLTVDDAIRDVIEYEQARQGDSPLAA